MLVEQHRAVDAVRRHVVEQRADDCPALERDPSGLRRDTRPQNVPAQRRHKADPGCGAKQPQRVPPREFLRHARIVGHTFKGMPCTRWMSGTVF